MLVPLSMTASIVSVGGVTTQMTLSRVKGSANTCINVLYVGTERDRACLANCLFTGMCKNQRLVRQGGLKDFLAVFEDNRCDASHLDDRPPQRRDFLSQTMALYRLLNQRNECRTVEWFVH